MRSPRWLGSSVAVAVVVGVVGVVVVVLVNTSVFGASLAFSLPLGIFVGLFAVAALLIVERRDRRRPRR